MKGFDHQFQKRDWTSAGVSNDTLLHFLSEARPAVMSLLQGIIAEVTKKKRGRP